MSVSGPTLLEEVVTRILAQLQASKKWLTAKPNLEVGDIVLMTDGTVFQTHWSLAKVVAVYPGEDNLVRAVDVELKTVTRPDSTKDKRGRPSQLQVKTHQYRRPVSKLALLIPARPDQT